MTEKASKRLITTTIDQLENKREVISRKTGSHFVFELNKPTTNICQL